MSAPTPSPPLEPLGHEHGVRGKAERAAREVDADAAVGRRELQPSLAGRSLRRGPFSRAGRIRETHRRFETRGAGRTAPCPLLRTVRAPRRCRRRATRDPAPIAVDAEQSIDRKDRHAPVQIPSAVADRVAGGVENDVGVDADLGAAGTGIHPLVRRKNGRTHGPTRRLPRRAATLASALGDQAIRFQTAGKSAQGLRAKTTRGKRQTVGRDAQMARKRSRRIAMHRHSAVCAPIGGATIASDRPFVASSHQLMLGTVSVCDATWRASRLEKGSPPAKL
jgi:hypothetical protein